MKWSEYKYFLAYIAPLAAFAGIGVGGIWSPAGVYVGFILIPLLELISPKPISNPTEKQEITLKSNKLFNWILFINMPILYGLIVFFIYTFLTKTLSTLEIIGMVSSVGVILGTQINVAHELGHKHDLISKWCAKFLLIPALYNHFTIEHNLGHHKNIGTPEDPATSRLNENVFSFWIRCIIGTYRNAWKLQKGLLNNKKAGFFSFENGIFWGHFAQLAYLSILFFIGGINLLLCGLGCALIGILLLESVNYIEHYGLTRKLLPNGRYERVETFHSWNANQEVGRIFLYELTRHADHHYKSTRPYQVLRHWDNSPQLPYGYPLSILLSLIPPLWFKLMNKEVVKLGFNR